MKVLLSVTFIYFFQTSLLEGFTIRSRNNQIRENASNSENPKQPSSLCSENCTFVINSNSLKTAKETFQEFMEFKKSMLLYLNIQTLNFTLKPGDQKKLNQFQEWQWTLTKNFWYLGLPIDLDYASFHITYFGESRIRLNIESLNSDCCLINDAAIAQIRNRLWSDVFSNTSKSLLCNRHFEDQDWKGTFFVITTVWVGYDLFCNSPDVDKKYSKKTNASATLLIPIICFYISMYYPLVNKLIESNPVRRHLKQIKRNLSDGMQFTDYLEGDSPFGYRRGVLKYFFVSKLKFKDNDEISEFLPMHRLNCIYCFLFFIYSLLPMVLEVIYDVEELKDFDSIYKLGMPIFNLTEQIKHFVKVDYRLQIAVSVIIIPFISIANFLSYKCLSESQDFLIYLKWNSWCLKTNEKYFFCISCIITEDVDDVINNIKSSCRGKTKQDNAPKNTENQEQITNDATRIKKFIKEFKEIQYYSKFIQRLSLILSKNFWIHIWTQSTNTTISCCCFCKPCNCQICQRGSTSNPVLIVLKYAIGVIIFFPLNCIFIILTCAFPTLWLMVFMLTFRLREIFSSKYHENEPSKRNDCCISSSTPRARQDEADEGTNLIQEKPKQKKTENCNWRLVLLKIIILIFIDVPVILLLYLQLSIIVLIVRSTMYIVFVAITNYDHLTRIVIAVITCASYLGSFLKKFMDKYTTILGIIFDEMRGQNQLDIQNNAQSENPTESTSTDERSAKEIIICLDMLKEEIKNSSKYVARPETSIWVLRKENLLLT
ncbi:uncharacterized protein LOC143079918 [Mytilus galloprovincialis]|uniref:uncharacterized protein LOC143079918 n=1 Tax=Mytilus galloprovincialis TaxID=29158 RepID=UPI003F7C30D7